MTNLILKQDLNRDDLMMVQSEFDKRKKSSGTAWLLWLFLGGIGGHRFYLGHTGKGLLYLFTLGGLGVMTLIDLFRLSGKIQAENEKIELEIISQVKLYSKQAI